MKILKDFGAVMAFVAAAAMFVLFDPVMAASENCDDNRNECVMEAINSLDSENTALWTKKGKPRVDALKVTTGLGDITAAERNAAWKAFPKWQERHRALREMETRALDRRGRAAAGGLRMQRGTLKIQF